MKLRTKSFWTFLTLALALSLAGPAAAQSAGEDAPEPGAPATPTNGSRAAAPPKDRRDNVDRRYEETVNPRENREPAADRRYDRAGEERASDERAPNERPAANQRGDARDAEPRRTESRAASEARAIDPRNVTPRGTPAATPAGNNAAANVAQANGGQPNPAAGQQNVMAAPFQLAPQEQKFVDELLAAWEKQSGGIKTFECDFTRWEYSPQFGAVGQNQQLKATAISTGELKYVKPDKGLFHVKETQIWNAQTNKFQKTSDDSGEHWICDGKKVWELNSKQKQVMEYTIPPEMQGTQISDGPLPFMLFGGEAAKIKARYFMRERTAPQFAKEEIWFEAYPKWQRDAANFRSAQLIMKRADFLPYALRMYSPNGSEYSVFEFKNVRINNPFFSQSKLSEPSVPRGWQMIRDPGTQTAPQAAAPNGIQQPPRQAARPLSERPAR